MSSNQNTATVKNEEIVEIDKGLRILQLQPQDEDIESDTEAFADRGQQLEHTDACTTEMKQFNEDELSAQMNSGMQQYDIERLTETRTSNAESTVPGTHPVGCSNEYKDSMDGLRKEGIPAIFPGRESGHDDGPCVENMQDSVDAVWRQNPAYHPSLEKPADFKRKMFSSQQTSALHGEFAPAAQIQFQSCDDPFDDTKPRDTNREADYTELSPTVWMYNKQRMSNQLNAKVYLGVQKFVGGYTRKVAIKLILYDDKNMKEISNLLMLCHPNIVQMYDAREHQSMGHWIYIVMELCAMNLEDFFNRETPVDHSKAMEFFNQIIVALEFMHGRNIAHRDIKPTNVLISKCLKYVKLSDFGISKKIPRGSTSVPDTCHKAGSEGYKPPELFRPDFKVSLRSDIFPLGLVTAYLFSHGKHPFGDDPSDWSYKIKHNMGFDLSGIPPDVPGRQHLIELIVQMLQHKPDKRPTIKQIKQDKFFSDDTRTEKINRTRATVSESVPPSTVEENHSERKRAFTVAECQEATKPQETQMQDILMTRKKLSVVKSISVTTPTADGPNSENEEIDTITTPSADGPSVETMDGCADEEIDGSVPQTARQRFNSNQNIQSGDRFVSSSTSREEYRYCEKCQSTIPDSRDKAPYDENWECDINNQLFIDERTFALHVLFWAHPAQPPDDYLKGNEYCGWPPKQPLKLRANFGDTIHLQFDVESTGCRISGDTDVSFNASWFKSCPSDHKHIQRLVIPAANKNSHEFIDLIYRVHTKFWPESTLHPRIINLAKHPDQERARQLRDEASRNCIVNNYINQHQGGKRITAKNIVQDDGQLNERNEDTCSYIGSSKPD